MARDVAVGDEILTWLGWMTVTYICPVPGFDDEEGGVSFSVEETGNTFHLKLSDEIAALGSAS